MTRKFHKWTPIAPDGNDYDPQVWRWCIRCGVLRLGRLFFLPGDHQQETIVAAGKPGPCDWKEEEDEPEMEKGPGQRPAAG